MGTHHFGFWVDELDGQRERIEAHGGKFFMAFELPPLPAGSGAAWRRIIDTAQPSPQDLCDYAQAATVGGSTHTVDARSIVVLFAAIAGSGADTSAG